MKRLYVKIYFAVLASLAVFALAAGLLWRQLGEAGPAVHAFELAGTLAYNTLPPSSAPITAQQAALETLAANLGIDVSLFAADRSRLAAVGAPLPAPQLDRARGGWIRRFGEPPAWAVPLPDGRWLVARVPRDHRHPAAGLFLTLALLALAVGVGAYPVVRRLTRRIETLQAGVESLGAGDLASRVKIEGNDEVARLAETFNRAAGRIGELVGAHKQLLANASHELRTPLARIRVAIELMKEQADPKRKRELEQDVAELDALIEEILLASRIDAVETLEKQEEVDLLALAAEECARYEEAELDGRLVTLRGDAHLLRRMIRNLLENARRHGAPPIELRLDASDEGVSISVRDHGPGIPEGERERVFEPFYRHAEIRQGGAGLGLALVRQIARRHGGDVACTSAEGGGSRFVVRLPLRADARKGDG